jgi:hypothetical protein
MLFAVLSRMELPLLMDPAIATFGHTSQTIILVGLVTSLVMQ